MQYLGHKFYYVEFFKMRRIRKKREKLELINKLKQQINKLLDIDIPMTTKEDLKSIRTTDSKPSSI